MCPLSCWFVENAQCLLKFILFLLCNRGCQHCRANMAQDAQDVLQDTFLQARAAESSFQSGRDRLPWVRGIARNVVLQRCRKHQRHPPDNETSRGVCLDERSSDRDGIAEWIEADHFQNAFDQISLADRTLIRLRFLDRWSYEEIATENGISVETARVRVTRARAKLTQAYRGDKGRDNHE